MRIVICGGGLQGVELCFLAKQAGFETVLIDKKTAPPARPLASTFVQADLRCLEDKNNSDHNTILQLFKSAHLVIPALENKITLDILHDFCEYENIAFAYDLKSYAITSSKLLSRDFFEYCHSPIPQPFRHVEDMSFPLLAKPSGGSGSKGVQVFQNMQDFLDVFAQGLATKDWIFEAYHEGPSYSVEVCGIRGHYKAYAVTALHMDADFDCCGVTTPSGLSTRMEHDLQEEAIKLACALDLRGIMDLEVIINEDKFVVLEIDARFPSQTPTAVYFATGVNLLEELAAVFVNHWPKSPLQALQKVNYEHKLFDAQGVRSLGEHIMAEHGMVSCEVIDGFPTLIAHKSESIAVTCIFHEEQSFADDVSDASDARYEHYMLSVEKFLQKRINPTFAISSKEAR